MDAEYWRIVADAAVTQQLETKKYNSRELELVEIMDLIISKCVNKASYRGDYCVTIGDPWNFRPRNLLVKDKHLCDNIIRLYSQVESKLQRDGFSINQSSRDGKHSTYVTHVTICWKSF